MEVQKEVQAQKEDLGLKIWAELISGDSLLYEQVQALAQLLSNLGATRVSLQQASEGIDLTLYRGKSASCKLTVPFTTRSRHTDKIRGVLGSKYHYVFDPIYDRFNDGWLDIHLFRKTVGKTRPLERRVNEEVTE